MTRLNKFPTTFYGDTIRWFVGIVINKADPDHLGRVQIRIYGIHDDLENIPNSDLPWAIVAAPTSEDGISGLGWKPNISEGATIIGWFLDGNQSQLPFVLGSIPKIAVPTQSFYSQTQGQFGKPPANWPSDAYRVGETVVSTTTLNLKGSDTGEKIFNYLTTTGQFSPEQAAGIMGNFFAESSLNPGSANPDDLGLPSYGLAQWRGPRRTALFQFAAQRGTTPDDLGTQLDFLIWEMNAYPYLGLSLLRKQQTPANAAITFMNHFERPSGSDATGNYILGSAPTESTRVAAANDYYNLYR